MGHNPISILIPCPRVVGSDGSLTGYGGGVAKKQLLLELEGVVMSALYIPRQGTALYNIRRPAAKTAGRRFHFCPRTLSGGPTQSMMSSVMCSTESRQSRSSQAATMATRPRM